MSIECLNAALKVEGLPTSSKFVLVVLSNYADENSCCYPSHSHIGKIVGIKDRKHIGKIIKQLEVLGYLKINKYQAKQKYYLITKTYDKDKLKCMLDKFVAHCEAEKTESKFIPHCSTFLNQRRFLDYEDIKIEDIKNLAKTKEPDNKPNWMRDKEILSKQNELRVSSSWSTENEPKKRFKANPKASQKLAEIAAKHNIKGRSR